MPPVAPARIELRDIRFRYPDTERYVLDGLSLTLEAGKRYALVGSNGCGKTTVTRLLTGLYPPDAGDIWVNGRLLYQIPPAELRALVSVVYQDFAHYSVSLRDNVFPGQDSAANGQILERPGLGPLVARLPQGVDTLLGKIAADGVDISGGEWQRVAIACGLYRPHDMIILDEPPAAIDPLEEDRVYRTFLDTARGKTAIIVTHRLGLARIADRILVMERGRIVQDGRHAELIVAPAPTRACSRRSGH